MKRLAWALGLAGLALVIALVARTGARSVLDAFALAGWPLLALLPLHVLPLALDAGNWRVLLAPRDPARRAGLPVLMLVAAVREAVNRLLPVAGIGGELVGIRIVVRLGVPAAATAASVLVEVVLTLVSLVLFALLGLLLLGSQGRGGPSSAQSLWVGLALAAPIPIAGLWAVHRGRLAAPLAWLGTRLSGAAGLSTAWLSSIPAFQEELALLAARPARLGLATLLILLGMSAGAIEVGVALRLLGHPATAAASLALEAIVLFVRNLAFAVPAGLGAQEAGIVLVGAALGIPADIALGLALAKRMREVLFGVPALAGWHLWETFARRTRRSAPPDAP